VLETNGCFCAAQPVLPDCPAARRFFTFILTHPQAPTNRLPGDAELTIDDFTGISLIDYCRPYEVVKGRILIL
jgi:hypothetical protein